MTVLCLTTLVVADVDAAVERFTRWFGYRLIDRAPLDGELARSWQAPASAGCPTALCGPASGAPVYLRFVQGEPASAYPVIRTLGWSAIELCVTDVDEVHRSIAGSPFELLGAPTAIGGLPTIRPMQVRGPDGETIFLTEILTDDPTEGLPRPRSLVDHLFIQVLACRDLDANARWFAATLGLAVDAPVAIRYSTINKAFGLSPETQHRLATVRAKGRIVIELDQYPSGTIERPAAVDALPHGVAICTLALPELGHLRLDWLTPPIVREEMPYGGRRVGTVRTPEGALLELIET